MKELDVGNIGLEAAIVSHMQRKKHPAEFSCQQWWVWKNPDCRLLVSERTKESEKVCTQY